MSSRETPRPLERRGDKRGPQKAGGRTTAQKQKPGFAARQAAAFTLASILERQRPLEEAFDAEFGADAPHRRLEPRDRAFARLLVMTVLREKSEIQRVLDTFLSKPLPARSGRLKAILLAAAAQLLFLDTPPHAAISLAVDQCRADQGARHFASLANAVLRRVATEGKPILEKGRSPVRNIPAWMFARWKAQYGGERAAQIAAASLTEAPLDLSVKSSPEEWALKLGGIGLPTGSVRLQASGRIEDVPGYGEGAWWVQDCAAALPARLLGNVSGQSVADLCAAPGGKTAELAAAGARVTAVDSSEIRLARLKENLTRLKLDAKIVRADLATWSPPATFDAVLLDAPCSATGTIRRHPDILHLKRESDIASLSVLQHTMLKAAARLVRPGGLLVYCTCSLEREEGETQIERFLAETDSFERVPLAAGEFGIAQEWINNSGELRTLPCHMALPQSGAGGMDGFFACRLRRKS